MASGLRNMETADDQPTASAYRHYTAADMRDWQENIADVARRKRCCDSEDKDLILIAPSVDHGARLLLTLLCWAHGRETGTSFMVPTLLAAIKEATGCEEARVIGPLHVPHFFMLHRFSVQMYAVYCFHTLPMTADTLLHDSGPGTGDGPRRSVIREALLILLSDETIWTLREGYVVPNWHSSVCAIPRRVALLRVAGTLIMLHFLYNGAPTPISPFLALLLLDGVRSFGNDPAFIEGLVSPTVSKCLVEWHELPLDEPFVEDAHPLASALFTDVEVNVSSP